MKKNGKACKWLLMRTTYAQAAVPPTNMQNFVIPVIFCDYFHDRISRYDAAAFREETSFLFSFIFPVYYAVYFAVAASLTTLMASKLMAL